MGYINHTGVLLDNNTKINYDVSDLLESFKSANNETLIGKSLFFDNDMKVYLIE